MRTTASAVRGWGGGGGTTFVLLSNTTSEMRLGSVVFYLTFTCFWVGGSAQNLAALNNKLRQLKNATRLGPEFDSASIAAMEAVQNLKAFWMPDHLESLTQEPSKNLGGKYGNISAECIKGIPQTPLQALH